MEKTFKHIFKIQQQAGEILGTLRPPILGTLLRVETAHAILTPFKICFSSFPLLGLYFA